MKTLILLTLFFALSCSSLQSETANDSHSPSTDWKASAQKTLDFVKTTISLHHPGPVDLQNPHFNQWLEKGHALALKDLSKVDSLAGEYFLVSRYLNGFEDEHLYLHFENQLITKQYMPSSWPGFVVKFEDNKFRVATTHKNFKELENSYVVSCDGKDLSELMLTNVFPFVGNEKIPGSWYREAWRLFRWMNNPFIQQPRNCVFENKGQKKTLNLDWQVLSLDEFLPYVHQAGYFTERPFAVRSLPHNGVWVSVPAFYVEEKQIESVKKVAQEFKSLSENSDFIVVDLRGNTGGSSKWTDTFLEAIYSKERVLAAHATFYGYPEYRVSDENLQHWSGVAEYQIKNFGSSEHFAEVSEKMALALSAKQDLLRVSKNYDELITKQESLKMNELKDTKKIYLLTDGSCFSACLDFMDTFFEIGQAIHLGLPTRADSVYMDTRTVSIPGQKLKIILPLKVYRARARGNNVAYIPTTENIWKYDIEDTAALESWILATHSQAKDE